MAVRAGARCSPIAGGALLHRLPASGPRGHTAVIRAGALSAPIAGGIILPSAGQWAARYLRLSSGRGLGAP